MTALVARRVSRATFSLLNCQSQTIYTDYLSRKGKKGFKPAFTVVAVCKCKSCSFVALCVILWVSLFATRGNAHLAHQQVHLPGGLAGVRYPGL